MTTWFCSLAVLACGCATSPNPNPPQRGIVEDIVTGAGQADARDIDYDPISEGARFRLAVLDVHEGAREPEGAIEKLVRIAMDRATRCHRPNAPESTKLPSEYLQVSISASGVVQVAASSESSEDAPNVRCMLDGFEGLSLPGDGPARVDVAYHWWHPAEDTAAQKRREEEAKRFEFVSDLDAIAAGERSESRRPRLVLWMMELPATLKVSHAGQNVLSCEVPKDANLRSPHAVGALRSACQYTGHWYRGPGRYSFELRWNGDDGVEQVETQRVQLNDEHESVYVWATDGLRMQRRAYPPKTAELEIAVGSQLPSLGFSYVSYNLTNRGEEELVFDNFSDGHGQLERPVDEKAGIWTAWSILTCGSVGGGFAVGPGEDAYLSHYGGGMSDTPELVPGKYRLTVAFVNENVRSEAEGEQPDPWREEVWVISPAFFVTAP